MEITEVEFHQIVNYVKDNFGVNLIEKKTLIMGRLTNYLTKCGYETYSEFFHRVLANPRGEEATALVNYLTTNHTFFMREPVHFNFLKDCVLPEIKKNENASRDLRIWSAAASSGEEAYTIIMVLRDFFQLDINSWDTTVLATDISRKALEQATKGEYSLEHLSQLPDSWAHRYFDIIGYDKVRIKEELRKQVIFRYFNLMDSLPFKKKFHVVFLRNVMIYFEESTKLELVNKIYDFLEPGGYLFIGTTETFERNKTKYEYIQPSVYRKQKM